MPRKSSVSYWPSRKGGGYFCVRKGVRHELALGPDDAPSGPTYLEALRRFAEVMAEAEGEGKRKAGEAVTVRDAMRDYLLHVLKARSPGTYEFRQRFILALVNHRPPAGGPLLGDLPALRLAHKDVYAFLGHMGSVPRKAKRRRPQRREGTVWGQGSVRNCIASLMAGFNWAARSGLIGKNPLAGIEMPAPRSRGEEALLGATAEEAEAVHRRVLEAVPAAHRAFVQALRDTGARPGELAAATAADFDPASGAICFRKAATRAAGRFAHKTSKRKDRLILLAGETLANVRLLALEHPAGPLFRRRSGGAFARPHILSSFAKARRALGMPHLTAYSYRHQFATSMLMAGMDIDTLAGLMGNSPLVLRQHYSHLLADARGLREKLERFMAAAADRTPSTASASAPAPGPPAPPAPDSPPAPGRRRGAPG